MNSSTIPKTKESETVFVGIDFGTSKTMAARMDPRSGAARPLRLGRGNDEMPTTIYVEAGGARLFGDSADDEGVSDTSNYATRFKMKLGKPGIVMRGKLVTAQDLARDFLTYVREYIEQRAVYAPVNSIILTVPAIFGPAQRKDLKDAAMAAGFSEVELLAEPVAAALGYCNRNKEEWDGQRLLVVDWGGGTLDIALVERRAGGELRVQGDFVCGLDDVGGEVLDDDVWIIASRKLMAAGYGSLEAQASENHGKYRRDLRLAKEQLSVKELHSLYLMLAGGLTQKIDLARVDFEEIIAPRLERAATKVKEIHGRSVKEGCPPDFILLVGGTCRIPAVKKVIEEATGVPCRDFEYGREAVALGAAVKAHALWGALVAETVPEMPKEIGTKRKSRKAGDPEQDTNRKATGDDIEAAISQYRNMLAAFLDKKISPEWLEFLEDKRNFLGLTSAEARALQFQVFGGPIEVVVSQEIGTKRKRRKADNPGEDANILEKQKNSIGLTIEESRSPKNSPFFIKLKQSSIGLQVMALAPDAHAEIQGEEFIRRTHFLMAYLLHVENVSGTEIRSIRISLISSEGQQHSILVPSIKPGSAGALSLTTADLEGWMITPGDRISVDASGLEPACFEVTIQACTAIDKQKALQEDVPCFVFVKKATFSSNFVLRVFNPNPRKIKINEFTSPAGSLQSPIEIEPGAEREIGWLELSNSRNLTMGEEFQIKVQGFRYVSGVVAEGKIEGGGGWVKAVAAAAGGILIATLGG